MDILTENSNNHENHDVKSDELRQRIYKEQKKVGILSFIAELPNFIAVLVTAILSRSLIMWLDLVDSFSNVARSSSVFLSSGKLEGNNVKDPGKLEFRTAMFCNISVLAGLAVLFAASLTQIINPEEPQEFLIWAVALKVINVLIDTYMFVRQAKLIKRCETDIIRAEYNGLLKDLIFDSATLIIVLISYLLIQYRWSWYISPAVCLLMCLFFIVKYMNDTWKLVKERK